ncbi:MAG: hypothetical protein JWM32_2065 [Verrucomicrobia bacterium]|nr:hypothetical protein [Verrucomicrobiota bacterium]
MKIPHLWFSLWFRWAAGAILLAQPALAASRLALERIAGGNQYVLVAHATFHLPSDRVVDDRVAGKYVDESGITVEVSRNPQDARGYVATVQSESEAWLGAVALRCWIFKLGGITYLEINPAAGDKMSGGLLALALAQDEELAGPLLAGELHYLARVQIGIQGIGLSPIDEPGRAELLRRIRPGGVKAHASMQLEVNLATNDLRKLLLGSGRKLMPPPVKFYSRKKVTGK